MAGFDEDDVNFLEQAEREKEEKDDARWQAEIDQMKEFRRQAANKGTAATVTVAGAPTRPKPRATRGVQQKKSQVRVYVFAGVFPL